MRLFPPLADIFDISRDLPVVHEQRCIHLFHKRAACTRCTDICPSGAIRIGKPGTSIYIGEECVRCEQCVAVCPVDAFSRSEGSEEIWLEKLRALALDDRLKIGCDQAPGKFVSRVGCLGSIHPGVVLNLLGHELVELAFNFGNCKACSSGDGRKRLTEQLRKFNESLNQIGLPAFNITVCRSSITCSAPATAETSTLREINTSRRQFLQNLRLGFSKSTQCSKEKVLHGEAGLSKRQMYVDGLAKWQYNWGLKADTAVQIPGAHIETSSDCNGCGLCAKLCRQNALFQRNKGESPVHDTALCSGCALCVAACRKGAKKILKQTIV